MAGTPAVNAPMVNSLGQRVNALGDVLPETPPVGGTPEYEATALRAMGFHILAAMVEGSPVFKAAMDAKKSKDIGTTHPTTSEHEHAKR